MLVLPHRQEWTWKRLFAFDQSRRGRDTRDFFLGRRNFFHRDWLVTEGEMYKAVDTSESLKQSMNELTRSR